MPSSIVSPFPFFTDASGAPLEAGYIYIGQSNLNPETAPVNVFWDLALTIPAGQPIRTVGGYPSRAGSPSRFYVSNDTYSITVRNKNHALVFSAFDQSDAPTSVFDVSTQLITATAGQLTFTLTTFTYLPGTDTLEIYRNGLRLNLGLDYLETNSSTVTLTTAAAAGDQFLFQGGSVVSGNQVPGSQVSFIQAGTGAVTRNMQDKARESVSVLDFGAVGDGLTDDTAAIQAAIDSGAKQVTGVAGQIYRITNTITINTSDLKLDFNHAQLLLDDPSGIKNHLNIGDGVTQRNSNRIQNIAFTRQQAATAGYAIDCNLVGVTYISNCRIYGNNEIYNGIRILKGVQVAITDNHIDNCKNIAIYLQGTNSGLGKTNDVVVRDNRIDGGINQFVTWDFVEGVYCRGNIFYNPSSTAVSVNASSNANGLVSFKFESNDFDTCGGSGLYIDNVSNVQICDCWFASNTADDIQIKTNVVACIIASNQFYPTAVGIRVEGVDCRINGNIISGGTTCVNLTNTANRVGICGNTFQNAQFGVNLDVAQNTHLVGNLFTALSSGTVTGVGGNGTAVEANVDSVVGTNAFITVGASPFTYTAGRRPESVSIFGGTVSQIALGANAIGFTSNRDVMLAPNQSVTVTYSSIPFMVKNIL